MTPAFFVDAGTVAARRGDLRLREMDVAYGVGFRIHSNNASSPGWTWRSVGRDLFPC